MKLTFIHAGTERTLNKHPETQAALKAGTITEAQAAQSPWYLRWTPPGGKKRLFKLPSNNKDAIRAAVDILKNQQSRPVDFVAFLEAKDAQQSVTIRLLAEEWVKLGLPFRQDKLRDAEAAATLSATTTRALEWWGDKRVATVNSVMIGNFAAWRAPHLRSADLELSAMSSLCQWAKLCGKIEKNPFAERPIYNEVQTHCHEACPQDDEVLHKMLAWMFQPPYDPHHKGVVLQSILAAGSLAFSALTGLRPGEPSLLLRLPPLDKIPTNLKELKPGTIFRDGDGLLRMKVFRLKNGQNPFVNLHPAAENFLATWRAWTAREQVLEDKTVLTEWRLLRSEIVPKLANTFHADDRPLFPLGTCDQTTLNRALNRASEKLELPHFKPHGFGRAFYVKVRRSFGKDDSEISGELGQATDAKLIRSVYGDPEDLVGGKLHDWLPNEGKPAWDILNNSKLPAKKEKKQLCTSLQ